MKIKRIFTAVLSFIMVLTMLPSMVFAAGNSDTSTDGSTVFRERSYIDQDCYSGK